MLFIDSLTELNAMPKNQAYLCTNEAARLQAGYELPFRCGVVSWKGAKLVGIEYRSAFGGHHETTLVFLRDLVPIAGDCFVFQSPIMQENCWVFEHVTTHRRLLKVSGAETFEEAKIIASVGDLSYILKKEGVEQLGDLTTTVTVEALPLQAG